MKSKHQSLLILTAFAFVAASRAALGQTVTNPGFEDNSIAGNGYGAISGWSNNVAASGVNTISQPFLEPRIRSWKKDEMSKWDQVTAVRGA